MNRWPHQLYIREARRMVSDFVMTEHHTFGRQFAPKSIGLGSYGTDCHEIRRIVKDGGVTREGKIAAGRGGFGPYQIGYDAIVPKRAECEILFVTFALSASHTALASIRMEPVFMVTNQSAATAACLALDDAVSVQQVNQTKLRARLLADGQVLEATKPAAPKEPKSSDISPARPLRLLPPGDSITRGSYLAKVNGKSIGLPHPDGGGCAILDLGGSAMVTSWSDYCVDYFPLTRKGAGYTSQRMHLVSGGEYFRPTGMAAGPDGAYYLADWVFSSYPVHGRVRLWKMEIEKSKAAWINPGSEPMGKAALLAKNLREGKKTLTAEQLIAHARGSDACLSDAALAALARQSPAWTPAWTPAALRAMPAKDRVWALVVLRRVDFRNDKWVRALPDDAVPEVRFECLRWIADAEFTSFSSKVEQMLTQPDLDYRLLEALLVTANTLRGKPEAGVTEPEVLIKRVTGGATPAHVKAYALRLAPAAHAKFTIPMLRELFASGDALLATEFARTLSARNADDARSVLAGIASNDPHNAALRADSIAGLASSAMPEHQALLIQFAAHDDRSIRDEALRALRFRSLDNAARQSLEAVAENHPESSPLVAAVLDPATINNGRPAFTETAAWVKRLADLPGKPGTETGRRIFFHPKLATCSTCHRHSGRGNIVGPDLTLIAQQDDAGSLLRSVPEPSRDVAPQFYPTLLKLKDGTDFMGILLRSSSTEVFRDITVRERTFQKADIIQRTELQTSLMPPELVTSLTDGELRDLLAFLSGK